MQWKTAITRVLNANDDAMRCGEIAEAIQEAGYRERLGATPAQTVASIISTSIKNDGERSPFVRVGHGLYASKTNTEKAVHEGGTPSNPDGSEPPADIIKAFGILCDETGSIGRRRG